MLLSTASWQTLGATLDSLPTPHSLAPRHVSSAFQRAGTAIQPPLLRPSFDTISQSPSFSPQEPSGIQRQRELNAHFARLGDLTATLRRIKTADLTASFNLVYSARVLRVARAGRSQGRSPNISNSRLDNDVPQGVGDVVAELLRIHEDRQVVWARVRRETKMIQDLVGGGVVLAGLGWDSRGMGGARMFL